MRATELSDGTVAATPATLDSIVRVFLARHRIPGLAIGIVRDGRTVYVRGFGVADPTSGRPVTAETLFHTASVSKVFVATAVMQLLGQDRLRLDDPVATYLPYFRLADEGGDLITIRQMLSHTSGMPDVRDYEWASPEHDEGALERYVRTLGNQHLNSQPGDRFSYSNMAFDVLGDLIAKVSGQAFEDYVREWVLRPSGMQRSSFLKADIAPNEGATPHVGKRRPSVSQVYPYHRAHAPSSTLHSSAEEMCNWIVANVNRDSLGNSQILDLASYELLWAVQATPRPDRHMGLGWMLAESPFGLWVFHGGRDVGFRSHLSVFPDMRAGLVILSNWSETPISDLRDALVRASFDPGPIDSQ